MEDYSKKYSLVWQKWVDPFGDEDIDPVYDSPPDDIGEFEDDIGLSDIHDQELDSINKPLNKSTKVIMTPMGLITYNEHTASGKIFNFWTGHTNFNISPPIVGVIQLTDGVEALDVFTRYRFRIAIGQLFEPAMVMSSVTNNVYEYLNKDK
jgi:hypothetical protein